MSRHHLVPRRIAATAVAALLIAAASPALALGQENAPPEGFHDGFPALIAVSADDCYANGWATDPDDRSARLAIRISVDGVPVAEIVADEYRQDLLDAGVSPDGFSSFWFNLRPYVTLEEEHTVLVEARDAAEGVWHRLGESPRQLTCLSAPPIGFHDAFEGQVAVYDCVAAGWAVDLDSPLDRVSVRVLVDGIQVIGGLADAFRQDLVDAGVPGDGFSSYTFYLGDLVAPAVPHEVRVQAQDNETGTWSDLGATPKPLRCFNDAADNSFLGAWSSVDPFDGSRQSLGISAGPGDLQVSLQDRFASVCADLGAASRVFHAHASGRLVGPDLLEATISHARCGAQSVDIEGMTVIISYQADSDQLLDDFGTTWSRRG